MVVEQLTVEKCRELAKRWRDKARDELDLLTRQQFEDLAAAWDQFCEELKAETK